MKTSTSWILIRDSFEKQTISVFSSLHCHEIKTFPKTKSDHREEVHYGPSHQKHQNVQNDCSSLTGTDSPAKHVCITLNQNKLKKPFQLLRGPRASILFCRVVGGGGECLSTDPNTFVVWCADRSAAGSCRRRLPTRPEFGNPVAR